MTVPSEIQTERLVLRAPQMDDARALLQAVGQSLPELQLWLPWANQSYTLDEARQFLVAAHDDREMETGFSFLMRDKCNLHFIGMCSLQNIEPSVPRVEIGYWLHTSARGQGFMTEAVVAMREAAEQNLGAMRVEINCDARNEKSANVAKRAGFELEARLRNDRRDHFGVLADTLIFARVRPENP